jgi:hypothetical protein
MLLFCLFGAQFVSAQSSGYLYYSLSVWISFGLVMVVSRYVISPKLLHRQFGYSIALFLILLSTCFLITGYFYARYLSEVYKIATISYTEKILLKETVPYLLIGAIIGFLNLCNRKIKVGKKILYWFAGLLIAIGIGWIVKYIIDTSYNGDDEIVLLNSGKPYTSLQDILNLPEFKNKIVYVDVWGTYCTPCFNEFEKYTSQLTQRYKSAGDIAFLYICTDSHPMPEMRWKDRIKTYRPKGYHVLVESDEEAKLSNEVFGSALEGKYFPYVPCYFIVGKDGKIVDGPTIDMKKWS